MPRKKKETAEVSDLVESAPVTKTPKKTVRKTTKKEITDRTFHFVAGLPRSGSTLFCNILNQNPRFYASGTSPLPTLVRSCIGTWSNSLEVQSQIGAEKKAYFDKKFPNALKGVLNGWHSDREEPVVFDKSRAWPAHLILLEKLIKKPKMIICLRDLRDIAASIERRANETALYGDQLPLLADARMTQAFSAEGVVGGPLTLLADLVSRGFIDLKKSSQGVHIVKYEDLCADPTGTMKEVYEFLEEKPFEHDFDNVKRVTQEDDSVYRFTYPHEGSGKVKPPVLNYWKKYLPEEIGKNIRDRYEWYYKEFY